MKPLSIPDLVQRWSRIPALPFLRGGSIVRQHRCGRERARHPYWPERDKCRVCGNIVLLPGAVLFLYPVLFAQLRRCAFVVQTDYHRVNYKNADGTLAVGRSERIAVVEHPDTALEDGYGFELWTFLTGADATFDDIYYARTAGTLHPRPIGVLTALNRSPGDEVVVRITVDEIVLNAKYLIYDAFDGEWLIFAELCDPSNRFA